MVASSSLLALITHTVTTGVEDYRYQPPIIQTETEELHDLDLLGSIVCLGCSSSAAAGTRPGLLHFAASDKSGALFRLGLWRAGQPRHEPTTRQSVELAYYSSRCLRTTQYQ